MKSLLFDIRDKLKHMPWGILANVYLLLGLGLYNLYSATSAHVSPGRFWTQVQWTALGTIMMIFWGLVLDIRFIERMTLLGYGIVCLLLLFVDLVGQTTNGSQRWISIGPVSLQPSELAKFITILIVARSFTLARGIREFHLLDLWRQIILIGIPFVLILVQPDLGTAGLCVLIASAQIVLVRVHWRSLLIVVVTGISVAALSWSLLLYDYQKLRVLNFLSPMRDPRGAGYHSIQSMIGVGNGGLWGKGFQQGTQAQLSFLPERHTDFIFSVWAEEHGFVGSVLMILLFATLILQIYQMAAKTRDTFSSLVVLGVAGFFVFHLIINVGMVLGVFPVVGVPLSLISYGGTHMVTALSCVGLLIAVERRRAVSVQL